MTKKSLEIKDPANSEKLAALASAIKHWARELGFQQCGITDCDLSHEQDRYQQWLESGYQGEMGYLSNHLDKRFQVNNLQPGGLRVISARMDYLPPDSGMMENLQNDNKAYIARYTLGRDYHKLMRKRLTQLGKKIEQASGDLSYRAFVDSAPLLERPIAKKAGLGWQGKHTLIITPKAGSLFFLGELVIDLPLPIDQPYTENHCGSCSACLDVCPTNAFPSPYQLDAKRCISYLTIELKGSIPNELRPLMGNRIFGCDDCQLICPWNRFSQFTEESDFHPRQKLDRISLIELFNWSEEQFLKRTEGSAIRRTGHIGWLRNIAVALGNSSGGEEVEQALQSRLDHSSEIVREHVTWALQRLQTNNTSPQPILIHPRKAKISL